MYAAIAKNGEPINGIKAGNRVVVFVGCSVSRMRGRAERVRCYTALEPADSTPLPKDLSIASAETRRIG